jgi:ferrous iron transport protein B
VFKGESPGMVIELPPYRMPTIKTVLIHMWERAWLYLRKAGTIILAASIVMWVLMNYPGFNGRKTGMSGPEMKAAAIENSAAGRIGKALEPVLSPLGFDWRIGTALVGTIAAKEVFISQMAVVLATDNSGNGESLRGALKRNYSPLTGFCILLFTLIGFPCAATVAVMKSESGSWKFALLQFVALTLVAWCLTALAYQVGHLIPGLSG